MIKQIDGKWYHKTEKWAPLDEPSDFEKQRCAMYRQGQKDRKEGTPCACAFGSYLDGWYNPEKTVPPYVTEDQKEAFNL